MINIQHPYQIIKFFASLLAKELYNLIGADKARSAFVCHSPERGALGTWVLNIRIN